MGMNRGYLNVKDGSRLREPEVDMKIGVIFAQFGCGS
jgi:hypothetical protein